MGPQTLYLFELQLSDVFTGGAVMSFVDTSYRCLPNTFMDARVVADGVTSAFIVNLKSFYAVNKGMNSTC
jgi:hypothetical protein